MDGVACTRVIEFSTSTATDQWRALAAEEDGKETNCDRQVRGLGRELTLPCCANQFCRGPCVGCT